MGFALGVRLRYTHTFPRHANSSNVAVAVERELPPLLPHTNERTNERRRRRRRGKLERGDGDGG